MEEKTIRYGGSNDIIGSVCPRCGKSPDKHALQSIVSGEASRKLMESLQKALGDLSKEAILKGYDMPGFSSSMMGTAVATIGSEKRSYVSLSGPGVSLLPHMKKGGLGKDVYIVDAPAVVAFYDFNGKTFTPVAPIAQGRGRDYPLGSCAAQKLLSRIFQDAATAKKKVTALDMSELLWLDFAAKGHNRDWSTGSIVVSCDTCKQVVPQMLCTCSEE